MSAMIVSLIFIGIGCKSESGTLTTAAASETTSGATETTTAGETTEAKHVVIRFVSDETAPESVAVYKEAIEQYEAENPNVTIQLELVPAANRQAYYSTNLAGGNPPDIAKTGIAETISGGLGGTLLEMDDVVDALGGKDAFEANSVLNINEHYYGVPYDVESYVMYVRTDLFEKYGVKIPENWDEWLDAAKKLTIDTDNDGVIDVYGTCLAAAKGGMAETIFTILTWQSGNTFFDKDLNPTFNNEGAINALDFMKSLAEFCPPGIGEYDYYEMMDAYSAERVASTIYAGRLLTTLKNNNPGLLDKTKAIPIPTDKYLSNYRAMENYSVFKESKNPEIAKDFVKFLLTGDIYSKFLLTVPGHLPPAIKADIPLFWNDEFVKSQKDNIDAIFKNSKYGLHPCVDATQKIVENTIIFGDEIIANPYGLQLQVEQMYAQVVQKVLIGDESPEKATEWGQSEVERIISVEKEKASKK